MTTIIRDVFLLNDFAKGRYRVVPQTERRFDTSESPLPLPPRSTPNESEWEKIQRQTRVYDRSGVETPLKLPKMDYGESKS